MSQCNTSLIKNAFNQLVSDLADLDLIEAQLAVANHRVLGHRENLGDFADNLTKKTLALQGKLGKQTELFLDELTKCLQKT